MTPSDDPNAKAFRERMTLPLPSTEFVSQAAWRERLGVSRKTFWQWRGLGLIPPPLVLPGRPRWRRADVDRITAQLGRRKARLFGEKGQAFQAVRCKDYE